MGNVTALMSLFDKYISVRDRCDDNAKQAERFRIERDSVREDKNEAVRVRDKLIDENRKLAVMHLQFLKCAEEILQWNGKDPFPKSWRDKLQVIVDSQKEGEK